MQMEHRAQTPEHFIDATAHDSQRVQVTPRRMARLARNAIANLLRLGAAWLVLLLVPPVLVRTLTHAQYATWMLVLQLTAYVTLFDGALQMSVSRFVARAYSDEDWSLLGETLSSVALLFTVAALAGLVGIALLAFAIPSLFHSIPATLLLPARASLISIGAALAIIFPASALAGLSLGMEKNHVNAIAGTASKLLAAAGVVWAALHHQGLIRMAVWTTLGILAQPAIYVLATMRQRMWSFFSPTFVRARRAWEFTRFCSASLASQLSILFISGLDLPIVAAFDFKNAGYYAVAVTVSNMLAVPHGAILSTLIPILSSKTAAESPGRMGEVLLRTSRLATALAALIAMPIMIGMPVLLTLWVGADYASHTLLFGELLTAALLIRLTLAPYALIGFSAGEQSKMLISPAAESVVNLLLSLWLVQVMGATGVALGTLIGTFVGIGVHFGNSMPRTRSMEFSKMRLLSSGILRPLALAAPVGLIGAVVLVLVPSIAAWLLLLVLFTAFLALILWKTVLMPEDRTLVRLAGGHLVPALSKAQS